MQFFFSLAEIHLKGQILPRKFFHPVYYYSLVIRYKVCKWYFKLKIFTFYELRQKLSLNR